MRCVRQAGEEAANHSTHETGPSRLPIGLYDLRKGLQDEMDARETSEGDALRKFVKWKLRKIKKNMK